MKHDHFLYVLKDRLEDEMIRKMITILLAGLLFTACSSAENENEVETTDMEVMTVKDNSLHKSIPELIEEIPQEYYSPARHQGTLNRLKYDTWESFTYEDHSQKLSKEVWVYLPYGYTDEKEYEIFYLSHGGWSNETTIMGTDKDPSEFKHVIDHSIEDGKMKEMILVMVTYNNTGKKDSWDYSLAIELTDRFHNELVNDILPAVESKYSTYAKDTTTEGLKASRDHRGFGGFSMGSVNTWCTFRYALDYFRYFMPMSGNYTSNGSFMASLVKDQGYDEDDFFIFAMSGEDDFAYSSFKNQIMAMADHPLFTLVDSEEEGNLAFREMAGYPHGREASNLYTYNGLMYFWNYEDKASSYYTKDSSVLEIMNDPDFEGYGDLIFPVNRSYWSGNTLNDLSYTWYGKMDPDKSAEIVNYMKDHHDSVFLNIYSEEERREDPSKNETGLFFFKGKPGSRFAICNAGGGMVFVGAMQDSFPHALELSKTGYNAFALIYRPGYDTSCEDLARAIAYIFEHADELEVDTSSYSLWGGSAGARMAAWLGSLGTGYFGEAEYPQPGAVIMQYTGLSDVYGNEPPTYNCVGTNDYIASYTTMERRIDRIKANGTDAMIEIFDGLSHGFGLGTGTVAEGWIDNAVKFWERNMD